MLSKRLCVINTSGFVLKTQSNVDKLCIEKKIDDADKKTTDTRALV